VEEALKTFLVLPALSPVPSRPEPAPVA
jgi:hypothetical protein